MFVMQIPPSPQPPFEHNSHTQCNYTGLNCVLWSIQSDVMSESTVIHELCYQHMYGDRGKRETRSVPLAKHTRNTREIRFTLALG